MGVVLDMENLDVNNQVQNGNINNQHMTLKNWICTLLLLMIPIANIVLMFVWAFGKDVNPSKKTFFQAELIVGGVVLVLYIIFFASMFGSIMNSMKY